MNLKAAAVFLAAFAALATGAAADTLLTNPESNQFRAYWYPNGAEISRYALTQSRYGEIHKGEAVMIFVTESMDPDAQVKADRPGPDDVPVLKLNATRRFYTGIYPYSVMSSIFSPVDAGRHPLPLKITFSAQEWCGHVFAQMNLKGDRYRVHLRSYFESEGDRDFSVPGLISEDAVFNRIRIAPADLPVGTFDMLPSSLYTRLLHRPLTPRKVTASLVRTEKKSLEGAPLAAYTMRFGDEDRTVTIFFEIDFPHRIQAWEETHRSLAHFGERRLTTRAERTHTIMTDYWNKHSNEDRGLLKKLGIDPGG